MSSPVVAVLLATYNGAACLQEQLDSLAAQTYPPARVLVSDDGSTDATRAIVSGFAARHPALGVEILEGPRRGSAANFLSLLARCPEDVDMACFCDQDDVWLPGKIARALAQLDPASLQMYCARTWECDETLQNRRASRLHPRPPGFANALVQNIAAGNTIALMGPALALSRAAAREAGAVVVHDWWIYQLLTGAGAQVIYDTEPVLLYRQHRGNLIGANRGPLATLRRLRHLFTGTFRRWNNINLAALETSAQRLTPENRRLMRAFAAGREGGPRARISMLRRTGVYRQGRLGEASLRLAALLGRL